MKRSSGVLLHITSLPSDCGVGDLGPSAYRFADALEAAGQSWWQVLPLTPVGGSGSPYSSSSLLAGNPLLISPEALAEQKIIPRLPSPPSSSDRAAVNYEESLRFKDELVRKAYDSSFRRIKKQSSFSEFCSTNAYWLDDYALYLAISRERKEPWYMWPRDLRNRSPASIESTRNQLSHEVETIQLGQYLFHEQWIELKSYCNSRGISILGDLPFYVAHDSSDVWASPRDFRLSREGEPLFVGGVPPDYFSARGQLWGNPVYDWDVLERESYEPWTARIAKSLQLFDRIRLDHFRGYVSYWEVPFGEKTAENGRWVEVPRSFLAALKKKFPTVPFVAEDLGVITQDVRDSIQFLEIPGMKVLQFAFDGSDDNPYLPKNQGKDFLVCTGTHDTNTVLGWYREETGPRERKAMETYLGPGIDESNVSLELVKAAMASRPDLCVTPLQDVLSLGGEARMNNPAFAENNWRWRALAEQLDEGKFRLLAEETKNFGRD
jgi:4-alpha-glucanotransferase